MIRLFSLTAFLSIFLIASSTVAQNTDEFNMDETFPIEMGGTINLSSDDAEVTITGSDREGVRVVVDYRWTVRGISFGSSNEFEMIVEEENGNLNIYEKPRNIEVGVIGSISEEYTIRIEAPRDVNLDIRGDDDDYQISGVDGSLNIVSDDTDILIWDCFGEEFIFSIDDGDLEMEGGAGTLEVRIDDGDIRIDRAEFTSIEATSDDGDIEISTTLTDGGSYRFTMDDADLLFQVLGGGGEFEIQHDDADVSTSQQYERLSDEDEEEYSLYRLMGGDASVLIRMDDGDVRLRVL